MTTGPAHARITALADLVVALATESETQGWTGGPETAHAVTILVRSLVDTATHLDHAEDNWAPCPGPDLCDCDWETRAMAILRPIARLYGLDPKDTP